MEIIIGIIFIVFVFFKALFGKDDDPPRRPDGRKARGGPPPCW